ncbi:MAG: ferritin-like domain-containing protein [Endomicrobia bacterium]|nr:ferritin-like domain-containing protein [Endomicrobiia bacterium]MCX7716037.1 ferritin-like domain-containing protein [Endomicrobiia bacterium]
MDNNFVAEILQEILEVEYTDIFVYNTEAQLFEQKLKYGDQIAKLYKSFALDELTHADIISKKILEFEKKPIWVYKNFDVSKSVRESLKYHVNREVKSIQLYSKLLDIINDRSFKIQLKGIQQNEKEHLEQVTEFLRKLYTK